MKNLMEVLMNMFMIWVNIIAFIVAPVLVPLIFLVNIMCVFLLDKIRR